MTHLHPSGIQPPQTQAITSSCPFLAGTFGVAGGDLELAGGILAAR